VAVPEIGQNLHELDWQFLPFRSFSIYSVEALTKRFTQTIIQSLADGLSCLSLGAPLRYESRSGNLSGIYAEFMRKRRGGSARVSCAHRMHNESRSGNLCGFYAEFMRKRRGGSARVSCAHRMHNESR
jgi:hypothetical protein